MNLDIFEKFLRNLNESIINVSVHDWMDGAEGSDNIGCTKESIATVCFEQAIRVRIICCLDLEKLVISVDKVGRDFDVGINLLIEAYERQHPELVI